MNDFFKKIGLLGDAKYLSQIKSSVVYKGLAVICSFMLIPLMLEYLGEQRFGIWITLFSIMSWVLFFDLGIGSGLRNRLSVCLADNRRQEAAGFISTAYGISTLLATALFLMICISAYLVNWQYVFNAYDIKNSELRLSVLIVSFLFLLNFVLSLVLQALHAAQKTSYTVLHQFLSNFFALFAVFVTSKFTEASLAIIAVTYGMALLSATLLISVFFYRVNKELLPNYRLFLPGKVPALMGLGGQFFVIQLAVLALFSTDKIIITQLFGPAEVSRYELVFKLFSVILIINSLLLMPLWSAYTQAAVRGEFDLIKRTLYKTHFFGIALAIASLFLYFFGKYIIALWIGKDVEIAPGLLMGMFVFTVLRVWCDLYAYLLNGLGVIKFQMWLAVVQAIVNVPLSIYFAGIYGVSGVVFATSAALLLSALGLPISAYVYLSRVSKKAVANTECNPDLSK